MGAHHHHHHHGHHHHHHDEGRGSASKNIGFAFALNFAFTIIECIGGFYTGSIAILSDALHDFGDTTALGIALLMERFAQKHPTANFSYGFRRWSLVSAAVTGLMLVTGTVMIFATAIPRLAEPTQPHTGGMILLAIFGIAANGAAALRVSKGKTLNEKTISWHLIEDVLGWVVILVGSIVMSIWDLPIIDPILSIAFAGFILFGVGRNLLQVFNLFLQGVPKSFALHDMCTQVKAIPDIKNLHDVHIWSLDGESHVLTMHAVVADHLTIADATNIKSQVRELVKKFGNIHLTLELERENEHCPDYDCGSKQNP